jgi:hypothetical protein
MNNKETKYTNNINYTMRSGNSGLRDHMIEHAMERFFGYMCKINHLDII